MIVVVAVVTYYTSGKGTKGAYAWAYAALGAMAGSAAGQITAIALGLQKDFNWKSVAVAGITAGVANGFDTALGTGSDLIKAVNNNILSQSINIAIGEQEKFDWKSVAVSAFTSPMAADIDKASAKLDFGGRFANQFTMELFKGTLTMAVSNDGKYDRSSVLTNAFGNALGNSIVGEMKRNEEIEKLKAVKRPLLFESIKNFNDMYNKMTDEERHKYSITSSDAKNNDSNTVKVNLYDQLAQNVMNLEYDFGLGENRREPLLGPVNVTWASDVFLVHQEANEKVLKDLPQWYRDELDLATLLVDEFQKNEESFMHAMRDGSDKNSNDTNAKEKSNAWIRYNLNQALAAAKSEDWNNAAFYEGIALHTMQDSTSPSHRDSITGELRPWQSEYHGAIETVGYYLGVIKHVSHEIIFPGLESNLAIVTRDVHSWISTGHVPSGNLIEQYSVDVSHKQQTDPEPTPLYYGPDTV